MKNREKILIIILLTLLLAVGINFVIKERERIKNEEIFRAKELKILDTENKAKDAMDKMECPFPLIGYNELLDEEKIKLSPKLNGLLLSLSVKKQKCSDYFSDIKYHSTAKQSYNFIFYKHLFSLFIYIYILYLCNQKAIYLK